MSLAADALKRAVLELGVDVPIGATEETPEGRLVLYLYGGRVVIWSPPDSSVRSSPAGMVTETAVADVGRDTTQPDDLTVIPGVGKRTAQALQAAGLAGFPDLAAATDATLTAAGLNAYTLAKVREYLYVNGYAPSPPR